MHAGVAMCENSACAQQPIVSSVFFCRFLSSVGLATHGVKETAWDVVVVPEVAVLKGIVGVDDEIRADICFLLR